MKSYNYGMSTSFKKDLTDSTFEDFLNKIQSTITVKEIEADAMRVVYRSGSRFLYRLLGGRGSRAKSRLPIDITVAKESDSLALITIEFSPGGPKAFIVFFKDSILERIDELKQALVSGT